MRNISVISLRVLDQIQRFLLIVTSVVLTLLVAIQVFMRYVLKANLMGMEELIVLVAFWLYFIGGSYGAWQRNHITADLTEAYIKNERTKRIVQLIVSVITIVISMMFTYYAYQFLQWGLEKQAKSSVLKIPMYYSQSAVFVGFFLMTFYFIVHFICDVQEINKKNNDRM